MNRARFGRLLLYGSPFLAAVVTVSVPLGCVFYATAVSSPVRPDPAWLWLWPINGLLAGAGSATGAVLQTRAPGRPGVSGLWGFVAGVAGFGVITAAVAAPLLLYMLWIMMHMY